MKGMKRKVLFFVLVILLGGLLTGCNIVITAPDCCPSQIECSLTVVATALDIYGEILVNGEGTGKHFLPYQSYQSILLVGIFCNEVAVITIRDDCGYLSHEEHVLIVPGANNNVVFSYWGPYGVRDQKGQNHYDDYDDCQCHQ